MTDFITNNTLISGLIGFVAPVFVPVIFGWISKLLKRELDSSEKKTVILSLSFFTVILITCFNYNWSVFDLESVKQFLIVLMTNYLVILGMVNTVYTMIVKMFPTLDQKLELLEKIIKK